MAATMKTSRLQLLETVREGGGVGWGVAWRSGGVQRDSCCRSSRTAVSKLILTAPAVPSVALWLPPAEKRFVGLIYDADMMKANRNSFVFMAET